METFTLPISKEFRKTICSSLLAFPKYFITFWFIFSSLLKISLYKDALISSTIAVLLKEILFCIFFISSSIFLYSFDISDDDLSKIVLWLMEKYSGFNIEENGILVYSLNITFFFIYSSFIRILFKLLDEYKIINLFCMFSFLNKFNKVKKIIGSSPTNCSSSSKVKNI